MKPFFRPWSFQIVLCLALVEGIFFSSTHLMAQTCPSSASVNLASNPDTYFPATASAAAGTKTITLGAAGSGSTAISAGDFLLVIQMQGAQINYTNTSSYGDGTGNGYGYTSGTQVAGTMEFAVANSSVPLAGGSLTLLNNLANSYTNSSNTGGSTNGNYRYQVIRVPLYYDIVLTGAITAPAWNGSTGGVVVIDGTNAVNMNGQTISAADSGFRGGGGRKLAGGTGLYTDYLTLSSDATNGSKGEGIAGTPRYTNLYNLVVLDNTVEGYPNGSYSRGAPGNAGGGATDGTPTNNAENAGGGGGGNGGLGGNGGQGWHATNYTGGRPGAIFAQNSASTLVMGGGGGAGDSNDGTGTPAGGEASSGMPGGGIAILLTTTITGTGTINVSGETNPFTAVNDGSGGGGAGGSALIYASSGQSGITVNASGGVGGNNLGQGGSHGPGGGGGGGVVYSNGTLNAATTVAGASNGLTNGVAYNSTPGSTGVLVQNIAQTSLPINSVSCLTLPVTFLSASAALNNASVQVAWSVTSELNVQEYIVERSLDGVTFSEAGIVPRASSTYIGVDNYTFDDISKITTTVVYYRIIEVDNDGHEIKSNVVSVNVGNAASAAMTLAPNPVQSSAIVAFTSKTNQPVTIRIIDMGGNVVWNQQYGAGAGRRLLTVDNVSALSTGVYILLCSDGANQEAIKLLMSH